LISKSSGRTPGKSTCTWKSSGPSTISVAKRGENSRTASRVLFKAGRRESSLTKKKIHNNDIKIKLKMKCHITLYQKDPRNWVEDSKDHPNQYSTVFHILLRPFVNS
jgi:hypothetical protein